MKKKKLTYFFIINLSFIGGFTDIVSFILIGTFCGHITGNAVLFAFHFASENFKHSIIDFISMFCFILASIIGLLLDRLIQKPRL